MIPDFAELDPYRLAAVLYGPNDDVDTLLADFAQSLLNTGVRVGGIVQHNVRDGSGKKIGMEAFDLAAGRAISICQPLGSGSMACKLDASGLAEAAMAVRRAISDGVDLIVVNKFSKQEASGGGLRAELAEAIISEIPVLTAVPEKCLADWKLFTADRGTSLLASRAVLDGWWQDLYPRLTRQRATMPALSQPLLADHHV
jgi:nucleoside-triphosphatase THEP1